MLIKLYEDKYKQEVIDLILYIQNEEAKINVSLDEQPDLKDITGCYLNAGGCFLVAVNDDDNVIGTLGVIDEGNGFGVLKKFFVRADYRSQKVGLKLYNEIMDFCESRGFKTLVLDTPSVAKVAHGFYEKNGFVRIDKEKLPVKYDFADRDSYIYIKEL